MDRSPRTLVLSDHEVASRRRDLGSIGGGNCQRLTAARAARRAIGANADDSGLAAVAASEGGGHDRGALIDDSALFLEGGHSRFGLRLQLLAREFWRVSVGHMRSPLSGVFPLLSHPGMEIRRPGIRVHSIWQGI